MSKKQLMCFSGFIAFVLTIVMVLGNFAGFKTAEVKGADVDVALELVTDTTTVYAGDEVTVKVNMSKNVGLTGLRFRVTFDTNVLELKSVKADSTLPLATTNKASTFVGYAFAAINQDDEGNDCDWTATGNLVTIKFTVKDTAAIADTKLTFDMQNTDAADLAVNKLNVEVNELTLKVACKHASTETTTTKEPTCTEKGQKVTTCTVCGETIKTEEIAAKGHTAGEAEVTKEPTCTEKGEKVTKCTVCGETIKTEEIAAKGHTAGEAEVTKEPTCTEKGEKVTKCTVCGETVKTEEIAAKGHTAGEVQITKEPTCTEKGEKVTKCTVCGETIKTEEIAAKGHTLGEYTVTKEATCTEKGEKKAECSACGQEVTEEIPAKGHTYDSYKITKEPTDTENGEMERECSVCHETVKTEIPKNKDIVFAVVEEDGTKIEEKYEVGTTFKFEAKIYGDVENPQIGSIRYVPVSYTFNGVETKWNNSTTARAFMVASIGVHSARTAETPNSYVAEIKLDKAGEYEILVSYAREIYGASGWLADGKTYTYSSKFAAEVKADTEKETSSAEETTDKTNTSETPDTGDSTVMVVIGIMMVAMAVVAVVCRKRIIKAE